MEENKSAVTENYVCEYPVPSTFLALLVLPRLLGLRRNDQNKKFFS